MPALMRENFQKRRRQDRKNIPQTARNSSYGKFTANIF